MYDEKIMEPAFPAPVGLEPGDSCYGEVTCSNSKGIYIRLADGTDCFSFDCATLRPGCKVLCTFKRRPQGTRRPLLAVDSVLEYAPLFAA